MSRLTLLQRLKPEVKSMLDKNEPKYDSSVRRIFERLGDSFFYSDLTISDVSSIYTFADISLVKVSAWDFKYGDNIFISETYEE